MSISSKPSSSVGQSNLLAGAVLAVMQVLKTHLAANRSDSFRTAIRKTWARGGVAGFYQGLLPWGAVEAATKGSILLISANGAEAFMLRAFPGSRTLAGTFGGLVGGATQAYAIMGLTTTMKTVEITRTKTPAIAGLKPPSTFQICRQIYAKEGIRGLNKGINAVALRQMTTWASRMGITRFIEGSMRSLLGRKADARLSGIEKIAASCAGGALSCWNQPLEVIRIEMQSSKPTSIAQAGIRPTMIQTAQHIYQKDGALAFFRGVTPRMMLAASVTTFMVAGGDWMKAIQGRA